ncbi:MAG: hypothetical protein MUC50_19310 [Myxococcota bacterium]|nr:hypothetical protein [Myxococcota bacterium]
MGARRAEEPKATATPFGRIVIAAPYESNPSVETLAAALSMELSRVGLMAAVEARRVGNLFQDEVTVDDLVKSEYKAAPGLIAVVGFACDLDECRIVIGQPRSRSSYRIRIGIDSQRQEQTSIALAATLREAFLGPLLPEMERLAREQKRIDQEPLSTSLRDPPTSSSRGGALWPWVTAELSYHGAYMEGATSVLHGPALGLSMTPRSYFALALTLGWLGIDNAQGANGTIETHRLAISVAARAIFGLGQAVLVIAPTLRTDAVYAEILPRGGSLTHTSDLDLLGGLEILWSLPMPVKHLGITLGASLLGSLVAHSYSIGDEQIAQRPSFSVAWRAGLTYGLPWPR